MVDPSFDPSSGHATGIPRGPVYPLIKNIPIKELKTCRRRRRRRRRLYSFFFELLLCVNSNPIDAIISDRYKREEWSVKEEAN